jgi:hypothetical protein
MHSDIAWRSALGDVQVGPAVFDIGAAKIHAESRDCITVVALRFAFSLVFCLTVYFTDLSRSNSAASQQSHPMEVVFKSPAQPEKRLLHDALADNRSETLAALLSAICDAIFTTTFLPNKLLLSSLEALEILEPRFRVELTNIDFNWSFTPKEQYIIQDASDGLYAEDDIEGAFYNHGGYNGIIALILYFRESQKIQKHWAAIIEGFRRWFVKRVAEMLSTEIVEWIPEFLSARGMFYILQIIFFADELI